MTDCTHERNLSKLRKDFGEVFLAALAASETVEIVLNSDGSLWHERLGEPLKKIGTMSASSADAVIRTLASYHHTTVTRENPSIECELPLDGSRFAGQIPPSFPHRSLPCANGQAGCSRSSSTSRLELSRQNKRSSFARW